METVGQTEHSLIKMLLTSVTELEFEPKEAISISKSCWLEAVGFHFLVLQSLSLPMFLLCFQSCTANPF